MKYIDKRNKLEVEIHVIHDLLKELNYFINSYQKKVNRYLEVVIMQSDKKRELLKKLSVITKKLEDLK